MSQGQQYANRKIINWPEYNKRLLQRGSLTLWLDDEVITGWYDNTKSKPDRGLVPTFSDQAA